MIPRLDYIFLGMQVACDLEWFKISTFFQLIIITVKLQGKVMAGTLATANALLSSRLTSSFAVTLRRTLITSGVRRADDPKTETAKPSAGNMEQTEVDPNKYNATEYYSYQTYSYYDIAAACVPKQLPQPAADIKP